MSDVNAVNKPRETDDVPVPPTLRKSLKNRHIQLIALGGATAYSTVPANPSDSPARPFCSPT